MNEQLKKMRTMLSEHKTFMEKMEQELEKLEGEEELNKQDEEEKDVWKRDKNETLTKGLNDHRITRRY